MYAAAIYQFENVLPSYVTETGLLTDELEDAQTGASQGVLLQNQGAIRDPLDERILPELQTGSENPGQDSYQNLQDVRAFAAQALGQLVAYDTARSDDTAQKALRAELYALVGYSDILLADFFCSGVPLSTLDYKKDFTYAPSSTTDQVYYAALAQFDTAITLARASDSSSIVSLAQVGQGRAYTDLGQYRTAADDVTAVPDSFVFQFPAGFGGTCAVNGGENNAINCGGGANGATVSDREGRNGLPYRSNNNDPRTVTVVTGFPNPSNGYPDTLTFPSKYAVVLNGTPYAPFPIATGVEARLIQAEAALQAHDGSWLTTLKTLHDTLPGVVPLTDPGTDSSRVALLFRERAYWLFLTGHRQGDLRRLLRQYSQYWYDPAQVYPSGPYTAPGSGVYGTDVTAPIPPNEHVNPLFHGCVNRAP